MRQYTVTERLTRASGRFASSRGAFCRGRCVGVLDGDLGAFWLDLANWGQTRHGVRRAR
jgi:hypothetical protein